MLCFSLVDNSHKVQFCVTSIYRQLVTQHVMCFLKGAAQKESAAPGSQQNQGSADHHRDEGKSQYHAVVTVKSMYFHLADLVKSCFFHLLNLHLSVTQTEKTKPKTVAAVFPAPLHTTWCLLLSCREPTGDHCFSFTA